MLFDFCVFFQDRKIIGENQFGFMLARSIMEVFILLKCIMEKYKEARKDLHIVFIDLEKAYDRIAKEVMWWVLEKKRRK